MAAVGGGVRCAVDVAAPVAACAVLAALLSGVLAARGAPLLGDVALVPGPVPHIELTRLAALATQLGAGPVLYPLLLALAGWRARVRGARVRSWVVLPVLALAAGQVLEEVVFATLVRTRPPAALLDVTSFSSGHTSAAVLGWGLLVAGLRRGRGTALPVAAGLAVGLPVAGSRVLLGAHWPTDVVAGLAVGVLLLRLALLADDRAASRTRPATARTTWTWAWLAPLGAALLPVALLLATPGPDRLKDLLVYQGAGGAVGAGHDVYGFRSVFDMPFTYPPFAALLVEPLSRMSVGVGQVLWTAASLAALVPLARTALAPVVARLGLPLTVTALLLSSPVRSHLRFGQVGVFLVLAVSADLLRDDRAGRGAGLGLATAVKLTPAVCLPWLLVTGSRARLRATVLWLAGGSVLGLLLLWRSSVDYLGSASHDTTRFGANDVPGNQSVRGMLLRSGLPDALVQPVWLAVVVGLVALGTWGAWRLERSGSRLAAVGTLAALSVAVSPISWVHHLVWLALPVAALVAAGRTRLAACWYAVLVPGLPALGGGLPGPWAQVVIDLQGATAVAAVVLLPVLCRVSRYGGGARASDGHPRAVRS